MKRLLLSLSLWLLCCCAVSAQGVPNVAVGVPNTPPGVQVNLNASVDPTINNDQTQGYQVGSLWQNSATGRIFIARAVAAGAAVWDVIYGNYFIAGNWYNSPSSSISTAAAGTIKLYPIEIKERITVTSLGVRVSTVSAAGNVQAAIYATNYATMRPTGNALVSSASMSTATAVNVATTQTTVGGTMGLQIDPGLYWFASNVDNATATFIGVTGNGNNNGMLMGSATSSNALGNQAVISGVNVTQTFGTWPSLSAASFTESQSTQPTVQMLVGSVP